MRRELDEMTVDTMVRAVRVGGRRETAAAAAGVTSQELRSWMARAEAGEPPFVAFRERLERAEVESFEALLSAVRKSAAEGKRGARRWLLENGYAVPPVMSSPTPKSRRTGRP